MSLTITIRVTPNASKYRWQLSADNVLKCYVTSRATDGKANAELIKKLAELLALPSRLIRIDSGHTTRVKRMVIDAEVSLEQFFKAVGLAYPTDSQLSFLKAK
jgi:uncharacterized protein YggU (UPF0235/DUF167 family)